MNDNTFSVINDEGQEIECEVLFTYEDPTTQRNFIVYTDNRTDNDGNAMVYASIFNPEEENPRLIEITEEDDWKLVQGLLDFLTSDEEL